MITVLNSPLTQEALMDFNKIKTTLDKDQEIVRNLLFYVQHNIIILQFYLALGLTNI